MRLFYSAASPFVRKVMACAITRGIDGRIELIPTNPHASLPELIANNPLSKVPCLVTDDGLALFDSPVICEFLDSIGDTLPLFPVVGGARWKALKQQAIGDGIMDAAVSRRMEAAKPAEPARDLFMARMKAAVDRTLTELEGEVPARAVDIGSISVACALGYLDFRFAHEDWRGACPKLAAWFEVFSANSGIARTVPPG